MLSSREVAAILSVPERTVRDKWREWGLPAYRIGKHLRWRERDLYAWIEATGSIEQMLAGSAPLRRSPSWLITHQPGFCEN